MWPEPVRFWIALLPRKCQAEISKLEDQLEQVRPWSAAWDVFLPMPVLLALHAQYSGGAFFNQRNNFRTIFLSACGCRCADKPAVAAHRTQSHGRVALQVMSSCQQKGVATVPDFSLILVAVRKKYGPKNIHITTRPPNSVLRKKSTPVVHQVVFIITCACNTRYIT